MGLAAAIIGGVSALGEGIFGAVGASEQEAARMQALRLRMQEIKNQTTQESIQQMTKLNKTLASQAAIRAARGSVSAGPDMVSIGDINQFAQDENADKLNEVFGELGVSSQMISTTKAARAQEITSPIMGVLQAGSDIANAYVPSSSKQVDTNSPYASEGADTEAPAASEQSPYTELPIPRATRGFSSEGPDTILEF